MNPNGGLLQRFTPLTLPSLGLDFYGATPSNTIYPTSIYTLQYDGYADFPRYPINFLADLNAFIGIETVHSTYPDLNPSSLPTGYNLVHLAPSSGYTGVTNYYMITGANLPLLEPLRALPVIGTPLADLLRPDLTMLVSLGYGDPNYGYSTSSPDVATSFGLFPHYNQLTLAQDLWSGTQQGVTAFTADIRAALPAAATNLSLANIPHTLASAASGFSVPTGLASALSSPTSFIDTLLQNVNTDVTTITQVATDSSTVLVPTADIAETVVATFPSYDVNLFVTGVQDMFNGDVLGGLQYALVAPVAADTALLTLAAGFEGIVLLEGAETVIGDLI